jgi:hypothetical protein
MWHVFCPRAETTKIRNTFTIQEAPFRGHEGGGFVVRVGAAVAALEEIVSREEESGWSR